jgi:hypothetical protein
MFVSLFILALGACGGGGGGESSPATPQLPAPPPSPDPPSGEIDISLAEGARFLRQASFGPAEGDVVSLQTTGYEGWIDNQINAPASSQLQHLSALPPPENGAEGRRNRLEAFFKYALRMTTSYGNEWLSRFQKLWWSQIKVPWRTEQVV